MTGGSDDARAIRRLLETLAVAVANIEAQLRMLFPRSHSHVPLNEVCAFAGMRESCVVAGNPIEEAAERDA